MVSSSPGFRELRLRQFRNFAELEQNFPAEGVAITGENGAGKTNLLEAIYYLEILRSFRGSPDEQLVRFGADAFHVRGRYDSGATQLEEVTAAFDVRGRRKRVTHNGVEPERLGDALGHLGAVVFSPDDVAIVRGTPGERRRFLDIVLSLNRPGYLNTLQQYRHILQQRNAALRSQRTPAALQPWDEALVETGSRIMLTRAQWLEQIRDAFARRHRFISGGTQAEPCYVCSLDRREQGLALDLDRLRVAFQSELERVAERERERGLTLVGPQRDELAFRAWNAEERVDLRDYGSGGQVRTAAIALRMVEADTIRARRDQDPLILLDDVFAELDRTRSIRILELLEAEQPGQVILTAPKESDLQLRHGQLAHWRIANGCLITE